MKETIEFKLTHLEASLIKEALRMRLMALVATLDDPDYDRDGVQEGIDIVTNLIKRLVDFEKDMPLSDTLLNTKYHLEIGLDRAKKELKSQG